MGSCLKSCLKSCNKYSSIVSRVALSTMAVHNRCCFRSRTPNRDGNGRSEMSMVQSDARIRDQAELKALRDEATLLRSEVKELKEVARHVVCFQGDKSFVDVGWVFVFTISGKRFECDFGRIFVRTCA